MKNKLVSILMPVYNAAPFLEACLSSILEQSHIHWELIAVDDFSTDNSLEILQHFSSLSPKIKVLSNSSKGIIPALRLAYENAIGDFITRMDADDLMVPSKLEDLSTLLRQKGKGHLAIGLVEYFSEGVLNKGYKKYEEWLNLLTNAESNFTEIYKECVIPSPCWMTYKDDFEKCGAFNSDEYPEDYDLCFRFYKKKLEVISVKKVLHKWRDHPSRSSRNDPNYADQSFIKMKVPYFLELDFDKNKTLAVWGSGKKGKAIVLKLLEQNIKPIWLSDNIKKIGHDIYGIKPVHFEEVKKTENAQIIIAVAGPEDQLFIKEYLQNLDADCFWFC